MSTLNDTATVTLTINGKQAEDMLKKLQDHAQNLQKAIEKAAAAGNRSKMTALQRELKATNRQISQIQSNTINVEAVLRRLDKATPKELNKTLSLLKRQLNDIERGSVAWDVQCEKIRKVKEELRQINEEQSDQEGFFGKMHDVLNNWQMELMGAAAAVTGLIMAARQAVTAFAEMDGEMANVRKFTGMTKEQVEKLNEAFKEMDTRTSRVDLNKLAEDAGRLGKSSQEDVLGFVKAADQINVALDDLGEGATLTLSKLTNIFGDEKRLGTEKSLLAVGSVINELSQNCTASAPYLANFAQRMAGVGAQAEMTIPQIMGFAAVLDSQGQAVEMSATSLSKLIMDMFKQQHKVITATGLDAQKFGEALKRGTNEGLLMLLERLHELGSIDVLAPVFKDMGENGARAAQVISALAGNLDMVKWEQEEAAKAFEEGTSVTKEFNVQNNTVEAGLDKARKRVNDLAVELGESLAPVMKHVVSSTTVMLRVLLQVVNFMKQYGLAVAEVAAAILIYTTYTKVATAVTSAYHAVAALCSGTVTKFHAGMTLLNTAIKGNRASMVLLRREMIAGNVVSRLMVAGTALVRAAYYALTFQLKNAKVAMQAFSVAMKANPAGLAVAAITAVVVAITMYIQKQKQLKEERMKELEVERKIHDEYNKGAAEIYTLTKLVHDNTKSIDVRRKALEDLKKIVPDYLAELDSEGRLIKDNTSALDDYLKRLKQRIVYEASKDKLTELQKELMDEEEKNKEISEKYRDARGNNAVNGFNNMNPVIKAGVKAWGQVEAWLGGESNSEFNLEKRLAESDKRIKNLNNSINKIMDRVGDYVEEGMEGGTTVAGDDDGNGDGPDIPTVTPSSHGSTDKLASMKEWKEKQEAINRISYAKGEINYEAYTKKMDSITLEYYQKVLARTDLSEKERLDTQASYLEAVQKAAEDAARFSVENENTRYDEELAIEKQRFIDGEVSLSVYEETVEMMELKHLKRMADLQLEGSKEQLQAQAQYQDKLFQDQKNRQKKIEEAEKKHQEHLKDIKDDFFGDNAEEKQVKYASDMEALKQVHDMEIAAAGSNAKERLRIEEAFEKAKAVLRKKYAIADREGNRSFLMGMAEDVTAWLDSDLGQAVTQSFDVITSGMSAIFSQVSSLVQAEAEIQTAAVEKRYEHEISAAEGNTYKVNQLEKKKAVETARIKKEANRKQFAMQVIQAVAQTAQNAIAAYGSAAAIPLVGYIMAPIAAAMAVAAGTLQIAAIKKQQQASEAQGYASGGFTPKGRKYEEVGVVHAGEWVASQELLASPVARPMIEALDYAQRTNTIGSLKAEQVSRAIAPTMIPQQSQSSPIIVQSSSSEMEMAVEHNASVMEKYEATLRKLEQRLEEPFVTVNTVTGDSGIKHAQDEYEKLMRNKSPKSWKK